MPTRKIAEPKDRGYCRDRGHNPPSMMVYENGLYEHECPSCGAKTVFRVNKPTFSSSGGQCPKTVFRVNTPTFSSSGGQCPKPAEIGTWDPLGEFLRSYDEYAAGTRDYRDLLPWPGTVR